MTAFSGPDLLDLKTKPSNLCHPLHDCHLLKGYAQKLLVDNSLLTRLRHLLAFVGVKHIF